ncbi:MAG TPA: NAD(+)/NADH kinase [Nitrososphaeraceae archaeon]
MLQVNKAAIITKINNSLAKDAARHIAKFLAKKKIQVFSVEQLGVNNIHLVEPAELVNTDLDLVFAIGGDGTTLRAFRTIRKSTPVFSLNIGGTRGILAEANTTPIEQQLHDIFNRNYFYDKRLRLQAQIDGKMIGAALNDIVITRTNLTKTPTITINVFDYPVSQKMDGVIISTPTGSTGHALSLGGPIVHENMNCVMILPIAPVNKTPALILELKDIIITSTDNSKIIIDGQQVFDSRSKNNITISRYPFDGIFLRIGKRGIRQLEKLGF